MYPTRRGFILSAAAAMPLSVLAVAAGGLALAGQSPTWWLAVAAVAALWSGVRLLVAPAASSDPLRRTRIYGAALAGYRRSWRIAPVRRGARTMIRLASLFWLALVAATGFATFKVKYAVQDIEDELNKVRRHAVAEQQEIHILRAEWTSLNQPERLADLNRRLLSLAALAPKQLQRKVEDIPLRPVPEPAEPLIAVAPEPTVPQPAAADVHAPADTVMPVAASGYCPSWFNTPISVRSPLPSATKAMV